MPAVPRAALAATLIRSVTFLGYGLGLLEYETPAGTTYGHGGKAVAARVAVLSYNPAAEELAVGQTLKLYANAVLETDDTAIEQYLSLIQLPRCLCKDAVGKWGTCLE